MGNETSEVRVAGVGYSCGGVRVFLPFRDDWEVGASVEADVRRLLSHVEPWPPGALVDVWVWDGLGVQAEMVFFGSGRCGAIIAGREFGRPA